MILVRPGSERGRTTLDWLDSRHSFSFGDYHDARYPGFRDLRVINDDRVGPGGGFGTHPHQDMEILTYVLKGALKHMDSLGNGSVIRAGDVQAMSAGRGVMHSEHNASRTEPVHFLQIWIMPQKRGVEPVYAQAPFQASKKKGGWLLIASGDGRNRSLPILQDADLHIGSIEPDRALSFELRPKRHAWVQVTCGSVSLNGRELQEGDGVGLSEEPGLEIGAKGNAEVLLLDLS